MITSTSLDRRGERRDGEGRDVEGSELESVERRKGFGWRGVDEVEESGVMSREWQRRKLEEREDLRTSQTRSAEGEEEEKKRNELVHSTLLGS